MKNLIIILSAILTLLISCQNQSEEQVKDKDDHKHEAHVDTTQKANSKKSIPMEAHGELAHVHVSIAYHSPGVRGRIIYGGLVPFGEVWVTGAHNATSITFSKDVQIADKIVPAGKYAFFTIPGEVTWTLILNKNWDQHLADDYDPQEDVLRLEVTPETDLPLAERLIYSIEKKDDNQGTIRVQWEKRAVSLLIQHKN